MITKLLTVCCPTYIGDYNKLLYEKGLSCYIPPTKSDNEYCYNCILCDDNNRWFIPVNNEIYEFNNIQYIGKNGSIEKY